MKKTKLLALVMAGVLSVSLFAGCSTTADSESGSAAETETEYTTEFYLSEYLDEDGYVKGADFANDVTLSDYKSMVIPKSEYVVTDDEVKDEIAYIIKTYFYEYDKEASVENGDTANINYVGTIDDVAFDGGTANAYDLVIGSHSLIDDFEEQLIGAKVGETVEVEVTFPEDYRTTDLAGKDAVFTVTINHIADKVIIPEYTDSLVKDKIAAAYGIEVATCADFDNYVKTAMENEGVSSYVYNEILGNCVVNNIPESAMSLQNDYVLANCENEAIYYGMKLDEYITAIGMESRETLLKANAAAIESAAQEIMIVQAIAKNEGLEVTDDMLSKYFGGDGYDAVVEMYGEPFLKFLVMQAEIIDMLELDTPREK